ncbi:hypothetical protein [Microbacterium testaceum]|uniref:hypothetical protein n=1 Tax=Microbacterium testaceum TaxID=2033 RepID=UPI000734D512|nr:hypothetical protein [Microbacterium testaceum]KTS06178.1 hypothetical protein NS283_04310 [Microbacterium testaceum]
MIERARPFVLAVSALTVVTLLSGCVGPTASPPDSPASEESFAQAKAANLEFKAAVAEVQGQIYAGEWRVEEYGDIPHVCDDGYQFSLQRKLPTEFSFHDRGPATMEQLRSWLTENGWQVEPARSYGPSVTDISIEARNLGEGVALLGVDLSPGFAAELSADVLELRATSTCHSGDSAALLDQLRGPLTAGPDDDGIPDLESPDATPLFERFAEG